VPIFCREYSEACMHEPMLLFASLERRSSEINSAALLYESVVFSSFRSGKSAASTLLTSSSEADALLASRTEPRAAPYGGWLAASAVCSRAFRWAGRISGAWAPEVRPTCPGSGRQQPCGNHCSTALDLSKSLKMGFFRCEGTLTPVRTAPRQRAMSAP
jgi:hypothetical protein